MTSPRRMSYAYATPEDPAMVGQLVMELEWLSLHLQEIIDARKQNDTGAMFNAEELLSCTEALRHVSTKLCIELRRVVIPSMLSHSYEGAATIVHTAIIVFFKGKIKAVHFAVKETEVGQIAFAVVQQCVEDEASLLAEAIKLSVESDPTQIARHAHAFAQLQMDQLATWTPTGWYKPGAGYTPEQLDAMDQIARAELASGGTING